MKTLQPWLALGAIVLGCPAAGAASPGGDASGACGPGYAIVAGPAVSATDPHLSDFFRPGETVPVGTYVGFKITPAAGGTFLACTVTNSAYLVNADKTRQIITQSDFELKANQSAFFKAWRFDKAGSFLVEVREASTKRVLATYPLTIQAK